MGKYIKREFQLGDYWLSQDGKSPIWQRTWFDKSTRQTRRASLGTTDLQEAVQALTAWFIDQNRPKQAQPSQVTMSELLIHYWNDHAQHARSSPSLKAYCRYWSEFCGSLPVDEATTLKRQQDFHKHLQGMGLKQSSINKVVNVGRAALNLAWTNGMISSVPKIVRVKEADAEPMGRPLDEDELRKLLGVVAPHVRLACIIMLGTACRPEAALQLTKAQCDFKHGLVELNPKGRVQTKKHRPTVRMPDALKAVLSGLPDGYLVTFHGEPVKSLKTSFRGSREECGFGLDVNLYSMRHTAGRWMRSHGVPLDQIAATLGHKDARYKVTEIYAPYHPSYLQEACAALDELLRRVCVGFEKVAA